MEIEHRASIDYILKLSFSFFETGSYVDHAGIIMNSWFCLNHSSAEIIYTCHHATQLEPF